METTNSNEETKRTNQKKGVLPIRDADFKTVAQEVAKVWNTKPEITLLYMTAAEFNALTHNFGDTFSEKRNNKNSRPQITAELHNLDLEIDTNSGYVKNYIENKYKKEAKSYFAGFGFVHSHKRYILPFDRNNRVEALKQMVKGVVDSGFEDQEFGLAYWTVMLEKYETMMKRAISTDSQVTLKTSSKNELKKSVKRVFNSLILILKANYPDTYKAELRAWGFQKEKY